MRILFITATRLGDAVLSTGVLAHLCQIYPQARITIACGPVAAGLFTRLPALERLILVEKQKRDLHWLALWWQLVGTKWDITVDLRGSATTLFLWSRQRAIMRGGRRPGHRLGHIAGALSLRTTPLPVVWTAPPDHQAAATHLPGPTPIIAFGPTANWPGKIWPAERFIALYHALAARLPGARLAIFGGPGESERAAAAPILAAVPHAIDLVGQLTLPEAAACLARCLLFVGNDSGLMHLAAAAGTPTLGLFGPTPSSEYAPAGRCTAVAVAEGPEAAAPMEALPVQVALLAALDLLQRDGKLAMAPAN